MPAEPVGGRRYGLTQITYGWARACRYRIGPNESNAGDVSGVMLMARPAPALPWSSDRYQGVRLVEGGALMIDPENQDTAIATITERDESRQGHAHTRTAQLNKQFLFQVRAVGLLLSSTTRTIS